jgi:3-dehydroquinate synthase
MKVIEKIMSEVKVTIPAVDDSSYMIHIGSGTLSGVLAEVDQLCPNKRQFVVTDLNVANAGHLETLLGGREVPTFVIDPPGEINKTIDTTVAIIEEMEKAFYGRDSVIVALGGGTVGDIAGFAAAIYKRGIDVVQIPTTTVSQADSSVGGKTGVDSSVSKNAFGAFWQPKAVYIDVETLKTLDDRQYRAGLMESVKHSLIADEEYFELFENNLDAILNKDMTVLEEIAKTNCSIKAEVVAEDPTEKNRRRVLNYGHTIGHAVETASGFDLLHGEAIAIGMIGAGLIEKEMSLSSNEQLARIENVLKAFGMPTKIPAEINKDDLVEIIKRDKKAVNKWPKFALLDKIGSARCVDGQWANDVPEGTLNGVLGKLYG